MEILKPIDKMESDRVFDLDQATKFWGVGVNFSRNISSRFLAILYSSLRSIENFPGNITTIDSNYNKMSFACYNLDGERLEVFLEPGEEMMFVTINKGGLTKKYRCYYIEPTKFSFTLVEAKFNIADSKISIQPKTTSLTIALANSLASYFEINMRPNSAEELEKRSSGKDHFWPIDEVELIALLANMIDSPIDIVNLYNAFLNSIDAKAHLSIYSLSRQEDGVDGLEEVTSENGKILHTINGKPINDAPGSDQNRHLIL